MANELAAKVLKHPVFKFLSSLKLAVFVLLSLSAVLGTATVLESTYGTRAVYLMVYGTWWFYGLLGFLSTNVFCAALSRYPWKKRQTGFVITHLGILVILFGSYLTMQFGVDGNLPVTEGDSDGHVLLTGLTLTVEEQPGGERQSYTVPESALMKKGELMEVSFPSGEKLAVTEWIPRAVPERQFVASPTPGIGMPTVHVEVGNARFHVDEWLGDSYPGKGIELNLGPAALRFRKLWTAEEEKAFLAPKKASSKAAGIGYLIIDYKGKTYRLPVEGLTKQWKRLGSEALEVKVDKYLPYAIVREGQLVSKSDQPVNPAVQVLVRDTAGIQEKHSVFAVFPEFSTMHKSSRNDGKQFGVKFRMVSSAAKEGEAEQSQGSRGKLELAQSKDDKKLFYRVFARSGETNASGEVKLNEPIATGWMDLKFTVKDWIPYAISQVRPRYVEKVAGTDNNFLSSLYVEPRNTKNLASGGQQGFWLSEGDNRSITLGGRRVLVGLNRYGMTLPFEIFLEKFTIGNDPGTTKAATYESRVKVKDAARGVEKSALISMNEPMEHGGYTFYQASYQLREGAPPVSVFSVNFDPGRKLKYLGSLIMCLGICLMFWMNPHYWDILLGSKRSHS